MMYVHVVHLKSISNWRFLVAWLHICFQLLHQKKRCNFLQKRASHLNVQHHLLGGESFRMVCCCLLDGNLSKHLPLKTPMDHLPGSKKNAVQGLRRGVTSGRWIPRWKWDFGPGGRRWNIPLKTTLTLENHPFSIGYIIQVYTSSNAGCFTVMWVFRGIFHCYASLPEDRWFNFFQSSW